MPNFLQRDKFNVTASFIGIFVCASGGEIRGLHRKVRGEILVEVDEVDERKEDFGVLVIK